MPFPGSQHPDQYGWPGPGAGPYEDYSYNGYKFASGVAEGTGPIWDAVSQLILDNGTQFNPNPSAPLTQANVNDWNFWGQETRQSRNSSLWSIHSWGLALDYNSADNPNRSSSPPDGPYRLPSNLQQLLDDKFGQGMFLFGGGPTGWGDWMHVELHGSPGEVALWIQNHPAGSTAPVVVPPVIPPTSTDWLNTVEKQELSDLFDQRIENALTTTFPTSYKKADGTPYPVNIKSVLGDLFTLAKVNEAQVGRVWSAIVNLAVAIKKAVAK